MNQYLSVCEEYIAKLKTAGNYRQFTNLRRERNWPKSVSNGKPLEVWCSTDYLGLSQNVHVINAMKNAADKSGVGAGGTRNIAGTYEEIVELEKILAKLHCKESALMFSSGYLANFAALSALGRIFEGKLLILSDELNHSSIIEGIKNSGCEKLLFRHNDMVNLEALLKKQPRNQPKLLVFESIYSMTGAHAKIREIAKLAKTYNALTFIDEVHAVGVHGPAGAGLSAEISESDNIDIIMGSLSKGFGVIGGYVAGNQIIIDAIRSKSSGFIFSSTLPIPVTAACLASLKHRRDSSHEFDKYWRNIKLLRQCLGEYNIPTLDLKSHIFAIPAKGAARAAKLSAKLAEKYHIYVQHINYPTVPVGQERLRVTTNALHNSSMIEYFAMALGNSMKEIGFEDIISMEIARKIGKGLDLYA